VVAKLFQLFQPIGGFGANAAADAAVVAEAAPSRGNIPRPAIRLRRLAVRVMVSLPFLLSE
jgi:hypothetical protein